MLTPQSPGHRRCQLCFFVIEQNREILDYVSILSLDSLLRYQAKAGFRNKSKRMNTSSELVGPDPDFRCQSWYEGAKPDAHYLQQQPLLEKSDVALRSLEELRSLCGWEVEVMNGPDDYKRDFWQKGNVWKCWWWWAIKQTERKHGSYDLSLRCITVDESTVVIVMLFYVNKSSCLDLHHVIKLGLVIASCY